MSLPKPRLSVLLGAAALIAGTVAATSAVVATGAGAAPAAAGAASEPGAEKVCAGSQEIRTDVSGKQMKADVTLCGFTDGRTIWYQLSPKCAIANPISPWRDFPSCYMNQEWGTVSQGSTVLTDGLRTSYAGPGAYTFHVDMHVKGSARLDDSSGTTDIWADGDATYNLNFTTPSKVSGAVMTAQTGRLFGDAGPVVIDVGNKGKTTAHNAVLRIGSFRSADTDAAKALQAYGLELTVSPRDAAAVAAAKKKAQGYPADAEKHTTDPRCVSSLTETFCDLGDLGPEKTTQVELDQILPLTDWHVSAAEDPSGESGDVPSQD